MGNSAVDEGDEVIVMTSPLQWILVELCTESGMMRAVLATCVLNGRGKIEDG